MNAVQNSPDVNRRFHTLKKKLKAFNFFISQISVSLLQVVEFFQTICLLPMHPLLLLLVPRLLVPLLAAKENLTS